MNGQQVLSRCVPYLASVVLGMLAVGATVAHSADEELPAVKKPKGDHPETFEELVERPEFKNARLLVPAQRILHPPSASIPPEFSGWEEHKRAMHLKTLKRSDQDHPDLRRTIRRSLTTAANKQNSTFQKIDDNLTLFRFTNFDSFIKEGAERKAIALGKAFFWDVRFSSDRSVACASCHYAAGTDHRTRGTVTLPVNFGVHVPWPNANSPSNRPVNGVLRPYDLTGADLVRGDLELDFGSPRGLFDPDSIGSFRTREVVGSLGIRRQQLKLTCGSTPDPSKPEDGVSLATDPAFLEGLDPRLRPLVVRVNEIEATHRQVTQRNAGTVINAVLSARNFHDSRAETIFNGRTGWGAHDDPEVNQAVFVLRNDGGELKKVFTWTPKTDGGTNPYFIANASLASQAVEPIVSDVEMSYRGRLFHHIADRMLDQKLLEGQQIDPTDSSLGPYANDRQTYRQLIREVFKDEWWSHTGDIQLPCDALPVEEFGTKLASRPYDHMEANFSLFWGLAIQIYESTLISDDSPFDREQRDLISAAAVSRRQSGDPLSHLSDAARRGWSIFQNSGCAECHSGAEFTAASITEIGLLKADGEPQFPEIPGEEDDLVVNAELCPQAPPLGVECMDAGGRFANLYDAGNYVIGASRFERRSSAPDAPPINGSTILENVLFASDAAHWEDNGIGAEFIPPEEQPDAAPFYQTPSELQRARFARHLLSHPEDYRRLALALGVDDVPDSPPPPPASTAQSPSAGAMRNANEKSSLDLTERPKLIRQSRSESPQLDSPDTQAAGVDTRRVLAPLGRGNPLNSTQDTRRSTAPSRVQTQNERQQDSPQPSPTRLKGANELSLDAPDPKTDARLNPWNLVSIGFEGKVHPLVTHRTPVPIRSRAREFLPDWRTELASRRVPLPDGSLDEKISDAGAFKTPTLRNIELTGPYMHNGSMLTLESVVEFYIRGGDFNDRVIAHIDDTRTGHQHPEMVPIPLSPQMKADLVEFLKTLTDDRVRRRQAPFDHPSLPLIIGIDDQATLGRSNKIAPVEYSVTEIAAVGKDGAPVRDAVPEFERCLIEGRTH